MLEILQFYVSSFWVWAGITYGISLPLNFLLRVFNRWLRSRNIAARGWPTISNMDADGNIVHKSDAA